MLHFSWTKGLALSLALGFGAATSLPVEASEEQPARNFVPQRAVSIYGNSGGSIGAFVRLSMLYRSTGANLRFTGRCDSACTLLIALPSSQTCVSAGAVFRFHAPTSSSGRMASLSKRYMMSKYPGWVRSYIHRNGGLTRRLVTMDSSYASRFMRRCV